MKLPDNATITAVHSYGFDNNPLQAMTFSLRKAQWGCENYSAIATFSSTDNVGGCTSSLWSSAAVAEAVNNASYTYWYFFEIPYSADPDDLRLWNLEIVYTVP